MHPTIFTLFALSLAALEVYAKLQNVTVKGVTMCDGKRVANVHVMLLEKDALDADDNLASAHTNEEGEFELFGEDDEIGSIEPLIRIHHTCDAKPGCERISEYLVPEDKIGGFYDMTYVTLDIKTAEDKIKCQ
uniref:Uncharacterized protein n=1 Tax=Caenorhabditis japonica TaxID=281687 RepID=A0A8R1DY68_CAEJA